MDDANLIDGIVKKHIGNEYEQLSSTLANGLECRIVLSVNLDNPFRVSKQEFMRSYFSDLLVRSYGNISKAAVLAELDRRHVHRLLHKLQIDASAYREKIRNPESYLKESIQDILEHIIEKSKLPNEKLESIYEHLDDISSIILTIMHPTDYNRALETFEKEYLEKALKKHNFDIAKTAQSIELSKRTLYRKIQKLNLALT